MKPSEDGWTSQTTNPQNTATLSVLKATSAVGQAKEADKMSENQRGKPGDKKRAKP